LDGDGDRVIMVDAHGEVVDGDELLFIIASARHAAGTLQGTVIGTVMSNLGLEQALQQRGINFARAAVGDRHVLEMLQQHNGMLGGESSGHILCLDRTTTGDGIITALQILAISVQTSLPLHVLKQGMQKCPQHMINVPLSCDATNVLANSEVQQAVRDAEQELGRYGRVLLRPSGTEPLIRVMVEGNDAQLVEALTQQIAAVVKTKARDNAA
jgi:phosphoglucosamine mutase